MNLPTYVEVTLAAAIAADAVTRRHPPARRAGRRRRVAVGVAVGRRGRHEIRSAPNVIKLFTSVIYKCS